MKTLPYIPASMSCISEIVNINAHVNVITNVERDVSNVYTL